MPLEITEHEWEAAEAFFNLNPFATIFQRKFSLQPHTFIKFQNEIVAIARKKEPTEGILGSGGNGIAKMAVNRVGTLFTVKIERVTDLLEEDNVVLAILKKLGLFFGQIYTTKRYTLLKFAPGVSLDQLNKQSLNLLQIHIIALQSAVALFKLHQLNIIHRDVKPQNIIIDINKNNVTATFIDFNFARITKGLHFEYEIKGTKGFKAPEIAEGYYSVESDIFALGKTFQFFGMQGGLAKKMISEDAFARPTLDEIISTLVFSIRELGLLDSDLQKNLEQILELVKPAFEERLSRSGAFLSDLKNTYTLHTLLSRAQFEFLQFEFEKMKKDLPEIELKPKDFFIRLDKINNALSVQRVSSDNLNPKKLI